MKKIFLLACFAAVAAPLFSQKWLAEMPDRDSLTFFDLQTAANAFFEKNPQLTRQKGSGFKQWKRLEAQLEHRHDERGHLPDSRFLFDEFQRFQRNFPQKEGISERNAAWQSLGPDNSFGGYSGIGRISCVAFHPTELETFWVGSSGGGLWKTTTLGAIWENLGDSFGLPTLGVASIAVNPTNPDELFVALGDAVTTGAMLRLGNPFRGATKSLGVLKTTDGGQTWQHVFEFEAKQGILTRKILMHPDDPARLLLAASNGLYLTENSGLSWKKVFPAGHFADIEWLPSDPATAIATSYDVDGMTADIYVSHDTGQTWVNKTAALVDWQTAIADRIDCAVSAGLPGKIRCTVSEADGDSFQGIWASDDSGDTWAELLDCPTDINFFGYPPDGQSSTGIGWYGHQFSIDPAHPEHWLVGGVNTWETLDGGCTWQLRNFWYELGDGTPEVHADKQGYVFHPTEQDFVLEVNDGGIYLSPDAGFSWYDISNGLTISQIYRMGASATEEDQVLIGLQDNGTKMLNDGSWSDVDGGDGMECVVDWSNPEINFTTIYYGRIMRTTDRFLNDFTVVSENIPGQPQGAWITPFSQSPTEPSWFVGGYDRVWLTEDYGDSWAELSDELVPGSLLHHTFFGPDGEQIYAGTFLKIFELNFNGAGIWEEITGNLPASNATKISYLKPDPTDPTRLIASLSGYADGKKVYEKTANGWVNISTNLPNVPVNCLEIDAETGDIYAGTDFGVFRRAFGQTDWQAFQDNLPATIIIEMEIFYPTRKLRAATYGRGLWESELPEIIGVKNPLAAPSLDLFPNPTTGDIWLKTTDDFEKIRLFAADGRLEKALFLERKTGSGLVKMEVAGLPSGVHFLQAITSDGRSVLRKVVVR